MSVTTPRLRATGVTAGLQGQWPTRCRLGGQRRPRFDAAAVFTSNRVGRPRDLVSRHVVADGRVDAVSTSGGASACTPAPKASPTPPPAEYPSPRQLAIARRVTSRSVRPG